MQTNLFIYFIMAIINVKPITNFATIVKTIIIINLILLIIIIINLILLIIIIIIINLNYKN